MSEPLKPVGWGCQFQDGTVCTYDYDQDKAERTALLNGGKAITLYTESQLEAARAEGRRAGLEEAMMSLEDGTTVGEFYARMIRVIHALADKDKGCS